MRELLPCPFLVGTLTAVPFVAHREDQFHSHGHL